MRVVVRAGLLVLTCGVALWSVVTAAQVIHTDSCRQACQERKSVCVSACGRHENPMECEEECHDALEDCLRDCR